MNADAAADSAAAIIVTTAKAVVKTRAAAEAARCQILIRYHFFVQIALDQVDGVTDDSKPKH